MTPEKAIELFREQLALPDYREQIPEYYEAMELAVETLEKQIPKEVIRKILDTDLQIGKITFKRGTKIYHCPSCGKFITGSDEHCRWCGQAIDFTGKSQ